MIANRCRIGLMLLMVSVLGLSGCATTIVPPSMVAEPVGVAVLDHGRHASLVLEVPGEATMVRYAYGDWQWFALRQTGPVEATTAILWPTQAALGRKRLPGRFSPATVSHQVRVAIEDAVYLEVEAQEARSLVSRLDGIFAANIATRIYSADMDLQFVHHPDAYWILHNSNHVTADWLRALGCRLEGPAHFSVWRLGAEPGS